MKDVPKSSPHGNTVGRYLDAVQSFGRHFDRSLDDWVGADPRLSAASGKDRNAAPNTVQIHRAVRRFKLQVHHGTRQRPVFALLFVRNDQGSRPEFSPRFRLRKISGP
jgi:hypothetical protein